jgi:phytanoyl-CoA hydroxylase
MTDTEAAPVRFAAPEDGVPSADMREALERDGFLILEKFASPEACAALMERAAEISGDVDPGASVFSTRDQAQGRDRYFLESGDKIRCFFEEDEKAVNKIGHAMHDLDPVYAGFSRDPRLERLVTGLVPMRPLLLQSMHIFKHAQVGGEVTCHQDASFLFTEPASVLGLWFALEPATTDNGCLFAHPGAHRGPLRARYRRVSESEARLETLDASPWPSTPPVALEVDAGALIVLHGFLPHFSGPNRSDRSRQAYTLHVIDGEAVYPSDNWLRRPEAFPLRGFV